MVTANVFGHQPFQVAFIQHDHMIEQVAAAAAKKALSDAILPRVFERCSFRFHFKGFNRIDNFCSKNSVLVMN